VQAPATSAVEPFDVARGGHPLLPPQFVGACWDLSLLLRVNPSC
jgi:hypothetical protein